MREFRDDLRRHCRAEIRTPVKHFVDCLNDILHRFMFHHVPIGSGTHRPQRVERFVVHREHQDRQLRKLCADILDQLDAVGAGQTQIHNRKVGLQPPDHLHRFRRVAGLAADGERAVRMNELFEPFAKQRVIIHDHEPFSPRWIASRIFVGRAREACLCCGSLGCRVVHGKRRSSLDRLIKSSPLGGPLDVRNLR